MYKMIAFVFSLILLVSACMDPMDELPSCNSMDPCSEMACYPENCLEDSTFLGLDTLWKSSTVRGPLNHMKLNDHRIYINVLTNTSFSLTSYSRSNGKLAWTYSNDLPYLRTMRLYGEKIIGQTGNRVFSLDANSGNVLTMDDISNSAPKTSEGYVLKDHYYTSRGSRSRSTCIRSHVDDLKNWEEVYTIKQSEIDGFEPNTVSYNLWENQQSGDEILVFQHRMAFPEGRIDLMAYNLTADSTLWWHKKVDENGNSNQRQITISQGRAYFQGTSKLRCFDIASGDLVWETNYGPWNQGGKSFTLGGIVFTASEDILVVKYTQGLLALNAATGEELWDKNDDDIRNVSGFSMTMYNDIIFFTHPGNGLTYSGPLWAIRASDGEEIWMKSTEFGTPGHFNGPVLIDENRQTFYTRHGYDLIAFRMPEDMY